MWRSAALTYDRRAMLEVHIRNRRHTELSDHVESSPKDVITLGSAPDNDVVLDDAGVSAHHARLVRRGPNVYVEDIDGTTGVQLNGLVLRGTGAQLGPADTVTIGPYRLTLAEGPRPADVPASRPITPATSSVDAIEPDMPTETVAVVPPPQLNPTYAAGAEASGDAGALELGEMVRRPLPHPPGATRIRIGRNSANDLVLGSPRVALEHAVIERDSGEAPWQLISLRDTNRTLLNGRPIKAAQLADGDTIRIGPYRLVVRDGEIEYFDEAPGVMLLALDLRQQAGRRRVILRNVSLVVEPHEFVAIAGASGSGKSTLLKALSGTRPASGGQVLLNDVPLYQNLDLLRREIGLVPQDDIVHRQLTVESAFSYAARLRLPRTLSAEQRRQRIEEAIDELGLQERRHTLIGRLSGGERKRVSIGVELLTKPPLFFLDEPTSGLDPATGHHTMTLLRKLADQGRTVVISTHVTRDIAMCDKVLFLTRGGRMAFFGTPDEALQYFGVSEIEQVYDLLESDRDPEEWAQQFRRSEIYKAKITTPLVRQQAVVLPDASQLRRQAQRHWRALPGSGRQFAVLTARYAATMLRDRKHLLILLLQAPIFGLLLWALFQATVFAPNSGVSVVAWQGGTLQPVQREANTGRLANVPPGADLVALEGNDCARLLAGDRSGNLDCHPVAGNGNNRALKTAQLAFLLAAIAMWLGTFAAIQEIAKEHAIYLRERMVNLRVAPYVASKFAVLLALVVVQMTLLLGATAAYIHFSRGALAGTYVTLLLTGAASVAVALAISAAVSNSTRAVVAAPLLMIPQLLFAGGLSPVQEMGAGRWFSFVVATRWAYEALGRVFGAVKQAAIPDQFPYTQALEGPTAIPWLILAGFVLAFGLLAVILQRLKDRT
jgi:ABC-type multidrug transport system ATPase subunit/pSer/pThr/pTyr-binding forkhead associated (FHA) protein